METTLKKFLEFNGKKIYFKSVDGIWWIAIKPICEALGVNYDRQYKNLKNAKLFGELYAIQHIVAADGKFREMVCLPERVIYGWLFKIDSNAPGFEEFQMKCNDLLFEYFHGTITEASKHLKAKSEAEKELEKIEEELQNSELYKKRQELVEKIKHENKAAFKSVKAYLSNQLSLWVTEEPATEPN